MSVSAGVVGEGQDTTVVTCIEVGSQTRCTTGFDGVHSTQMMVGQVAGVRLSVCRSEGAEDIGDLERCAHEICPPSCVEVGGLSHKSKTRCSDLCCLCPG